jgi:hypothetical protein
VKVWFVLFLVITVLTLGHRWPAYLFVLTFVLSVYAGRKRKISPHSSYKATNPIPKVPPPWLNLTTFTSQRFHLQRPSHWRLGLQHMDLGRIQTFSPKTYYQLLNIKKNITLCVFSILLNKFRYLIIDIYIFRYRVLLTQQIVVSSYATLNEYKSEQDRLAFLVSQCL